MRYLILISFYRDAIAEFRLVISFAIFKQSLQTYNKPEFVLQVLIIAIMHSICISMKFMTVQRQLDHITSATTTIYLIVKLSLYKITYLSIDIRLV